MEQPTTALKRIMFTMIVEQVQPRTGAINRYRCRTKGQLLAQQRSASEAHGMIPCDAWSDWESLALSAEEIRHHVPPAWALQPENPR